MALRLGRKHTQGTRNEGNLLSNLLIIRNHFKSYYIHVAIADPKPYTDTQIRSKKWEILRFLQVPEKCMPFSKPCVCQYKVEIAQLPCFDGPHLLIHLLMLHLHFSKGCANQLQDYLQLYNLVALN